MIYKSNCKVNIGLYVTSKRDDEYHNIYSLFYPVYGLYDTIEVAKNEAIDGVELIQKGVKVDCSDGENLCVKAYNHFKKYYSNIGGVKIVLDKKIPFGAGMGGGSSNAATVLKALNELFETKATNDELKKIAAEIGSDVTFFIDNRAVVVEGVGDIFSDTDIDLSGCYISIVKPEIGVSTAKAYSMITPQESDVDYNMLKNSALNVWGSVLRNDFEEPIINLYPIIGDAKKELIKAGAEFVMMSGSGSAVYGLSRQKMGECAYDYVAHNLKL